MSRSAMIESLEDRRLLSASPLATKSKIPNILGTYSGSEIYGSGVTYAVTIRINVQHGAVFTGAVVESSGITARISGTVNKAGTVRIVENGTFRHHFSSVVVGSLDADTITATFTKTAAGLKFHGSISATRATTTST